jgi:hypothetical protein
VEASEKDKNVFLERSKDEPEPECKGKDILGLGKKCLDVLFLLSKTFPQHRNKCEVVIENNAFLAMLHKMHPSYRMVNTGRVGGRASLIGYLLCVINSSHTF